MSATPDNLVLEHLLAIRAALAQQSEEIQEIKALMASIERSYEHLSELARIERRADQEM